jgi:hypothetical protein
MPVRDCEQLLAVASGGEGTILADEYDSVRRP